MRFDLVHMEKLFEFEQIKNEYIDEIIFIKKTHQNND